MKTVEEINKQIIGCEWFIKSHKEQLDFHSKDGDLSKVIEYAQKIKTLSAEISLLKWVLEDEKTKEGDPS